MIHTDPGTQIGASQRFDRSIGVCPDCGTVVALANVDYHRHTTCPECSARIALQSLVSSYNGAVACDDRCMYAIGKDCSCACGGRNHFLGYMTREWIPQWVRDRDAKRHADKVARREVKAQRERNTLAGKIATVVDAHPLTAWLTYPEVLDNDFLTDVASRFALYGELSERQIAAVERAIERDTERSDTRAQRAADKRAAVDSGVRAPEGKATVTGVIRKIESRPGYAYNSVEWKMTVALPDGTAVWMTVPRDLLSHAMDAQSNDTAGEWRPWSEYLTGRTVRVTATFTVSDRDPLFSFGKRPRAELLPE